MLIWKVIAANPGISRQSLWDHVEHSIPDGYAIRLFTTYQRSKGRMSGLGGSGPDIARARNFVLTNKLKDMRRRGTISVEGVGSDRRFTTLREPQYFGNPEAIDETGTKAAEHMALADALRKVEHLLAQPSVAAKIGRKNCEAIAVLVKALRVKGPA